ncbi:nucleoside monophosphate kinase [Bradyrhizobium sp. UFLA05-112]
MTEFVKDGKLVPGHLVVRLITDRIARPDAAGGFILDGFPRTVAQVASIMSSTGTSWTTCSSSRLTSNTSSIGSWDGPCRLRERRGGAAGR